MRTSDFESNPIFSLTIEDGITPKTDRYERTSLITKTEDLFKIVSPNEFVTNPMNLRFGAFGYNKNSFSVCVSGYYDVFSIDNDKCSGFWNSYFKTPVALKRFDDAATGSLIEKRRVKYSTLCQLIFLMPKGMGEKKQIGAFFDRLDTLITLHQRKYDKLCVLKKSMLDKMFPKGGSLYPEIRFAGFTDPWEQRKLSSTCEQLSRTINPLETPNEEFTEYSMPAFDNNETAETVIGNSMNSLRKIVDRPCLLVNKLNVRKKRIWHVPRPEANAVCSSEFVPFSSHSSDLSFIKISLLSERITAYLESCSSGSSNSQKRVTPEIIMSSEIIAPSLAEQRRIGAFFDRLDSLITLHQRKLELLRNIKKSMLDKMFV